jgi:phenylacetate-CoA ligase
MTVRHPGPGELEPIETASTDELQHAYDKVAHYRKAFDARGVHPSDCKALADIAKFPFTMKGKPLVEGLPVGKGAAR